MNKFKNLVLAAVMVATPILGFSLPASALTYNNGDQGCTVSTVGTGSRTNAFKVSGNEATAYVQVEGKTSCKETISLASWNGAFGVSGFHPAEAQRFYMGKTTTLTYGKHYVSIQIDPSCEYQADIALGTNPKGPNNSADYPATSLIGYTQVFAGVCEKPVTPAPTPTPTPAAPVSSSSTSTSTSVSIASATVNNSSTPATPTPTPAAPVATTTAAQPTALVNTGPGSVIAIFIGVTAFGYIAHRVISKRQFANR